MIATGIFLLVVCIALPFMAWSSHRYLSTAGYGEHTRPSSNALALQAVVVHGVVLGLAGAAAVSTELQLAWFSRPSAVALLSGLAIVALFVFVTALEARRPLEEHEQVRAALRRRGLSKAWLATMVMAAVAEEYAYRGVLYGVLQAYLSPGVAGAVVAVAFGLSHLSQGVRGAVAGVAFSAAMQVLFVMSGALILPMACHLLYDLSAAWMGRFLTSEGREGSAT